MAQAWARLFLKNSKNALLQTGAIETLEAFKAQGLKQVILSASKQNHLHQQVGCYPIGHFFEEMLGLKDIYAASKVSIAKAYLKKEAIDPNRALFIGDTLHDAQVAQAIGVQCLLVARGHQPRYRLIKAGVPVFDDLFEAKNTILDKMR